MEKKKNAAPAGGVELLTKEYPLPPGCSCKKFVMRELTGLDDLEIAIWTERRLTSAMRDNPLAMIQLERKEAMRRSLVSVDGVAVNVDGVPYAPFDLWSKRTMSIVVFAFGELNGVENDEMEKVKAGSVTLSGSRSSEEAGAGTAEPSAG